MRSILSGNNQQQAKEMFSRCMVRGYFDVTKARRELKTFLKKQPSRPVKILVAFKKLVEQKIAQETAIISLPYHPTNSEQKRIQRSIVQQFPYIVSCRFAFDPTLVGGLRVQNGDIIFESSLLTRLKQLEQTYDN